MNHPLKEDASVVKELIERWKEYGKSAASHENKARSDRESQRILSESIQLLTGKQMTAETETVTAPPYSGETNVLRGTKEEIILAYMREIPTAMRSPEIRHGILERTGIEIKVNTFDMIMSKLYRTGKIEREKKGLYKYKQT